MKNKYCPNDGAGLEQKGAVFVCSKCHAQWKQVGALWRPNSEEKPSIPLKA